MLDPKSIVQFMLDAIEQGIHQLDGREFPRLEGSALDDALNVFAYELDARDDVHATARYRRDLVRMIGRDLVREVLQ